MLLWMGKESHNFSCHVENTKNEIINKLHNNKVVKIQYQNRQRHMQQTDKRVEIQHPNTNAENKTRTTK